jgi:hypothetical protein
MGKLVCVRKKGSVWQSEIIGELTEGTTCDLAVGQDGPHVAYLSSDPSSGRRGVVHSMKRSEGEHLGKEES